MEKTINERTLVLRVERIIAKRKEFICLLRTCYPNHGTSNKCVNDSGARRENHCETQGIQMFTTQLLPKPKEKQ